MNSSTDFTPSFGGTTKVNAATQTLPIGLSSLAMSKEAFGRAARFAVLAALAWAIV